MDLSGLLNELSFIVRGLKGGVSIFVCPVVRSPLQRLGQFFANGAKICPLFAVKGRYLPHPKGSGIEQDRPRKPFYQSTPWLERLIMVAGLLAMSLVFAIFFSR